MNGSTAPRTLVALHTNRAVIAGLTGVFATDTASHGAPIVAVWPWPAQLTPSTPFGILLADPNGNQPEWHLPQQVQVFQRAHGAGADTVGGVQMLAPTIHQPYPLSAGLKSQVQQKLAAGDGLIQIVKGLLPALLYANSSTDSAIAATAIAGTVPPPPEQKALSWSPPQQDNKLATLGLCWIFRWD